MGRETRSEFLRLANLQKVPDYSRLSKKRSRLPQKVFELKIGMATMMRVPPFMRTTTG
jgi:hypothetical protein